MSLFWHSRFNKITFSRYNSSASEVTVSYSLCFLLLDRSHKHHTQYTHPLFIMVSMWQVNFVSTVLVATHRVVLDPFTPYTLNLVCSWALRLYQAWFPKLIAVEFNAQVKSLNWWMGQRFTIWWGRSQIYFVVFVPTRRQSLTYKWNTVEPRMVPYERWLLMRALAI